ncbi:MAG: GNAT family N-acetyltransferase [Phycisphaeraceae bacterium]|nr:GNAT family N-acetyltransferase [Phycisphaeraceae bacterium]
MNLTYECPSKEHDLDACVSILCQAFASAPEGVKDWIVNKCDWRGMRTARADGRTAATLLLLPMGQYFGGSPVPMVGVAGVGVLPDLRGRGVGNYIMAQALREMRRDGVPISSLYPATVYLYQRSGYERAGSHFEHRIPVTRLPQLRGVSPARPFTPEDLDAVKDCYNRGAHLWEGAVQRGTYIWDRILHARAGPCNGFVVDGPSGIEAYAFLRQDRQSSAFGRHEIHATDIQASSPLGARSILTFLAGYGSMAEDLVFPGGGALHPITPFLPEHRWLSLRLKDYWMLRLVDLPRALALRGYPAHARAQVVLDVRDDLLPENTGRWLLTLRDGHATCAAAPAGPSDDDIRCDVRVLAAIYSGFISPLCAYAQGAVQGPMHALETLAALMPQRPTACFDFF